MNRLLGLTVAALAVLALSSQVQAGGGKTDKDAFQGAWTVVKMTFKGEGKEIPAKTDDEKDLTFKGDKAVHKKGGSGKPLPPLLF